ncbi:MAG: ATP phosphoribosyltransferase regulatory subunit [Oscillospiraceae bacterium]|nr:ATP phosphoribosyltransferase regulatory subunit [Oscillospiraceae bacterium]
MIATNALRKDEEAVLRLRSLYESRGYQGYKMNGFEEYDIYAQNKDFLGGEAVITFTDTEGRLMALKPDVTMSIIRSRTEEDGVTEKLYYDENVCRVSHDSHRLKEILQSGLECIGNIDLYNTREVVSLAAESLGLFGRKYILDISHMGIVTGLIDNLPASESQRKELTRLIASKNLHGIADLLLEISADDNAKDKLLELAEISGSPDEVLPSLRDICSNTPAEDGLRELEMVAGALRESDIFESLRLDFSVVQDMSYYNGIVFQGFIEGIPEKVLSGGRYDPLLRRIGKNKSAIGFALNVESLERILDEPDSLDADIALLYSADDDAAEVAKMAGKLSEGRLRVRVLNELPKRARFGRIVKFNGTSRDII